jgi:hypothetical protein
MKKALLNKNNPEMDFKDENLYIVYTKMSAICPPDRYNSNDKWISGK